jgi:hypothetical protein
MRLVALRGWETAPMAKRRMIIVANKTTSPTISCKVLLLVVVLTITMLITEDGDTLPGKKSVLVLVLVLVPAVNEDK